MERLWTSALKSGTAALMGLLMVLGSAVSNTTMADGTQLTVVELFTSQGCSSCPPADAVIGELAKRDDVMALSLHVDYWNYLGWADKFARPEHTQRQYDYKNQFDSRYVYTPQIVVHGAYVPKNIAPATIEQSLEQAAQLPRFEAQLMRTQNGVELALPAADVDGEVQIYSVFYDRRHDTAIKNGENGGRTLAYFNVVREIKPIGIWRGNAKKIPVTMAETGGDVCAVILQRVKDRQIVGAVRIALDGT